MSLEVFTPEWTETWAEELRTNEAYRKAAATWEGSILLEMRGLGDGPRAVFADLWHGDCRDARLATEADLEEADYIISATVDSWKKLLAGKLDPIFGLMTGKLDLRRGSVSDLMPYMEASKQLVAAAARIEADFPA